MFLSNIKLWNFRKFGSDTEFDPAKPNLSLPLKKGLNVLIGENDSGKTAIIDAIKLVLGTHSFEWTRVTEEDFYNNTERLRIELTFEDLAPEEAKNFIEWIGWAGEGATCQTYLRLNYEVKRNSERIFPSDVRAGADSEGHPLGAEARDYLKATYLKPLRDAKAELVPKRNSRLSQIFQGHEAFKGKEKDHHLMGHFGEFNKAIEKYFEGKNADDTPLTNDTKGKDLKDEVDRYIKSFSGSDKISDIAAAEGSLRSILEKLELSIEDEINPGLGTLNRLFMASELVHLNKKNWHGLRLGLIEELEAHLHPQAQMQVIEGLQNEADLQIILTTHSPNLASKVKLDDLIICNSCQAFPMGKDKTGKEFTALDTSDHKFLEWFLDVTKSNLFFAKGVIMVEGWAEEILLPALARIMKKSGLISKDLTEAGVSIVNVGGTSFLRYSKVFVRKEGPEMDVPVSIVTDIDVPTVYKIPKQDQEGKVVKDENGKAIYNYQPRDADDVSRDSGVAIQEKESKFNSQKVKVFVAPKWTLEFCLAQSSSLAGAFAQALKTAHPQIDTGNLEHELAKKLIDKSLDKTEIAHHLTQTLEGDSKKESPEISLDDNDESIKYLLKAIKHACRN
ncbi:MAG: AAA family ATPase [Nitrospiraceae bacterium]|nr:AAA family ATPase [Nitrospiraceae bacterium]